jgi:hypothetical protein
MPPNLNSEDYYEILGCPRNASDADLKKAYRKLAVKVRFHVTLSYKSFPVPGVNFLKTIRVLL